MLNSESNKKLLRSPKTSQNPLHNVFLFISAMILVQIVQMIIEKKKLHMNLLKYLRQKLAGMLYWIIDSFTFVLIPR